MAVRAWRGKISSWNQSSTSRSGARHFIPVVGIYLRREAEIHLFAAERFLATAVPSLLDNGNFGQATKHEELFPT